MICSWAVYYFGPVPTNFWSGLKSIFAADYGYSANPQAPALHLKIAMAGDDAIGAQRVPVSFQQGTPYSANSCVAKGDLLAADLVVLGAYEGNRDAPFEIMEDGKYETATTINVSAASNGKNLVLVVSAYDPVVWNFQNFPTDRLKIVIVFGHEAQAVANLPKSVPVRFNTRRNPYQPCGEPAYAYEGGPELDKFASNLEQILGKSIDRFNGAYNPEFLSADAGHGVASIGQAIGPERWQLRASAPMTRKWLLPAEAGIAQLVDAGAMREATDKDIDDWHRRAAKAVGQSFGQHRERPLFLSRKVYVVTKAVEIPSGLFGADSLDFIVLDGVPRPRPSAGHNEFYFMETGTHAR